MIDFDKGESAAAAASPNLKSIIILAGSECLIWF